MRGAVIEIAGFGPGRLAARLAETETDYPGSLDYRDFVFVPASAPDTEASALAYGTALHAALSAHPAIARELGQIMGAPAAHLEFRVGAVDAERLRWEALYVGDPATLPGRFPALAETCLVCRIAQTVSAAPTGIRAFPGSLTMMAFLSPAGVDVRTEYETIRDRVRAARAGRNGTAGLDLHCEIYLADQAILDEAARDEAAGLMDGLVVAPIPDTALKIGNLLRDRPVHLLHFFCHGLVEAGEQLLELATINDRDIEAPRGSIRLSVERLKQALLAGGTTWLTVLNCCSGAQAGQQLHSMALELAKRASPLAIGMAEPIDSGDATFFAAALYDALLTILSRTVAPLAPGESRQLDLRPAIRDARAALRERHAPNPPSYARWALPVVYRWDGPLTVLRTSDDIRRRTEVVAQALSALPVDAPEELRTLILASLDTAPAVPPALRPDRRGRFGTA